VVAARSPGETLDLEAEEILAAARDGSPRAWEAIFVEFAPAITRFAASRGVPDPEDVTQEVMEVAATRLGSFRGGWDQLRSWLFSIAYRRCADHHRRRHRRPELPAHRLPEHPDPDGAADEQIWAHGAIAEAVAALEVLDERERLVVSLRVIEGRPVSEVAESTGLSSVNVRVIQSRALAKLRSHVATNGGQLDRRFRVLGMPVAADLWRRMRALLGGSTAAATTAAVSPIVAGVAAVSVATVVGISVIDPPSVAPSPPPQPVAESLVLDPAQDAPGAGAAQPPVAVATDGDPAPVPADPPAVTADEVGTPGAGARRGREGTGEVTPPAAPSVDSGETGAPSSPDDLVSAIVSLPPITPANLANGSVLAALLDLTESVTELGARAVASVTAAVDVVATGVEDTVDSAVGTVRAATEEITSGVGSAVSDVAETTQSVTNGVTELVEAVGTPDSDGSVVDSTTNAAASTIESAVAGTGSTVETVVDTVDSTVDTVVEGVASTAESAVETVTDTVDEVVGTVGGLVGGLFGGG
jgi:RNA polymerase sigma factor (sigma-70 family)